MIKMIKKAKHKKCKLIQKSWQKFQETLNEDNHNKVIKYALPYSNKCFF